MAAIFQKYMEIVIMCLQSVIQTASDIADEEVMAISSILDENCVFQDKREQRTTSVYLAFMLFVYGFIIIITLVSILNIVNSISMSVSARTKQYIMNMAVTETINEL